VCVCCLGVVHAPVQSTRCTLPPFSACTGLLNDELGGPEDSVEKGGEEDGGETGNAPKSAKQCKYLETKEKNIAYLKK